MSVAFATMRANVRVLYGDLKPSDFAVERDALDRIIISQLQKYAGEAFASVEWAVGATLTAGNVDATLTGEHHAIYDVRRSDNNEPMVRLSEREIEEALRGDTTPVGPPSAYYIRETTAQIITLRFDAAADQNYTFDILSGAIPADSSTAALPVSQYLARAIENASAALAIARCTPEARARLGVAAEFAEALRADAERFAALERVRITAREMVGEIPAVIH